MEAEELVMVPGGTFKAHAEMIQVNRAIGQNDVGIVAWLLTLKTPECPQGRQVGSVSAAWGGSALQGLHSLTWVLSGLPAATASMRVLVCGMAAPEARSEAPAASAACFARRPKRPCRCVGSRDGRRHLPPSDPWQDSLEEGLTTCPAQTMLSMLSLSGMRQVVAVANDITFNLGSFGPQEDAVFRAATEHALEERLPLVYLAANSGARVGLANEIKQCLKARLSALPQGEVRAGPNPLNQVQAACTHSHRVLGLPGCRWQCSRGPGHRDHTVLYCTVGQGLCMVH